MTHVHLPQPFPLSKFMDPVADSAVLAPEIRIVEAARATEGQHELRWWEYAMAHRAIQEWQDTRYLDWVQEPAPDKPPLDPLRCCDVGGAGSRFCRSLLDVAQEIDVIDPNMAGEAFGTAINVFANTLEEYGSWAAPMQFDVLTALSVLEHVEEVPGFLRACHLLLKPGGLFFLTVDAWNCDGPDTAHFHWMRKRIYNASSIRNLLGLAREIGFRSFGGSDWTYGGNFVYDYTFASIALTRKP